MSFSNFSKAESDSSFVSLQRFYLHQILNQILLTLCKKRYLLPINPEPELQAMNLIVQELVSF